MATPFVTFTGSDTSALTGALLAANSGITINSSSTVLNASAQEAVNFYDGSLSPLGIGAGLLLTSGTMPGTTNTVGWFGTDNSFSSGFNNGDADINAVVNTVFQTLSYDATSLSFDFTVADPSATSISFDIVFGSDEYPEWVDAFVDSAVVMVNGVNYALFNHDPNHPLSVVSSNLAAGYFQDNASGIFPIEYDGVSHVLKIVAPINSGGATNQIKIAIADTGDHIYDSGIFIANLSAGNIPGSGVVITPPSPGTDNSDNLTGTSKDEYFDLKGGDDTCSAGAGDDIIVAGAGNDTIYGGSGNDEIKGDAGDDILDGGDGLSDTAVYAGNSNDYSVIFNALNNSYTISDNKIGTTSEGKDTLTNIEFAKFSNGLFVLTPSGLSSVANPNIPPPNTPGSVIISGVGSAGGILTATVSDPDGVSSTVNYQWQVSSNDGENWSNVGINSNSYEVSVADVGNKIQVVASYIDDGTVAESPVSVSKTILETNNGDLVVTLMQLKAPLGTSTINPLTTLIQDAIDLGLSPNLATLSVKTVLAIPDAINLQTYDAYAVLQVDPSDPIALQVEKVVVQIAILTSLSDDDTGINLTSAIITAAANNQTLDLANIDDLSSILGIPAIVDPDTGKYPEPLNEIYDRNNSMSDAIADGGDVSNIEQEWQDLLSIQDGINSTSIADLSIYVNQAPTGTAIKTLAEGTEGFAYILTAADLLQGFTDSDGGVLSVADLSVDVSGSFLENTNDTWTFTPDANYNGPVELTYTVIDGQGGSASASQLFVIAANPVTPINNDPTGTATATLVSGTEDTAYTLYASDLLDGFSDVDGDTLSISGLTANNGELVDNNDDTWTFIPNANYNGTVNLSYGVADGKGGIVAASQSFSLAAVNDAPTGTATATLVSGTEDTAYTIYASDLLDGFSDVDGDTLSISDLTANNGGLVNNNNGTWTFNPTANYNGTVNLSYSVTDGSLSAFAFLSLAIAPVDDTPIVANAIAPVIVNEDAASTIIDLTNVFSDVDGDAIAKSIFANSNTGIVTATILNNQLTLDYLDNQFGTADITLRGTANGQFVDNTFKITVNPINDAPTDITLNNSKISENTPFNALVGRLSTLDPDLGDTHTYNLLNDAGGRFQLVGNELRVKDASKLDYESQTNHTIQVRSTDKDSLFVDKTFKIEIQDDRDLNISGTTGDDLINGGIGGDTIRGNGGKDIFIYRNSREGGDTITDFNPVNDDRIDLSAIYPSNRYNLGTNPFANYIRVNQVGSNSQIQFAPFANLSPNYFLPLATLENVIANQIDASDFIFT